MYSESDIEGAVAAGAISPQSAAALRQHIAATRDAPAVDGRKLPTPHRVQ
jgi:hypothetical protein